MSAVLEQIKKALGVAAHGAAAAGRRNTVFAKSADWTGPVEAVRPEALPELIARIRTEAAHLNLHVHECASLEACGAELAALAEARPAEWGTSRTCTSACACPTGTASRCARPSRRRCRRLLPPNRQIMPMRRLPRRQRSGPPT